MHLLKYATGFVLAAALGFSMTATAETCEPSGEDLGHVLAVGGDAIAETGDGCRRHLVCGDVVHEGETLVTGGDAHLRVVTGDVVARLGADTRVELGQGSLGVPVFTARSGHLRLTDTLLGENRGAFTLETPHLRSQALGSDAEIFVVASGDAAGSTVCEWQSALSVEAGGARVVASPGECATADAAGALSLRAGQQQAMDDSHAQCPMLVLHELFDPVNVASALHLSRLDPPVLSGGPIVKPCDMGTCGGNPIPPPPIPEPEPEPEITTSVVEGPATPFTLP